MPTSFSSKPHVYKIRQLLGESLLSQVYLAERSHNKIHTKQLVVLKVFKNTNPELSKLQMESLLRAQHSTHLAKILGFEYLQKNHFTLVLEYIHGVNLKQLLKVSHLNKDEKSYICQKTLKGLKELKAIRLAHGDLSLSNVLIDYTGQIRLIDYGLANYKGVCFYGTQPFTAPEIYSSHQPNFLSDLFSLGVLEYILKGDFSEPELLNMKNSHFINNQNCLLHVTPSRRKEKEFFYSSNTPYLLGMKVNKALFFYQHLHNPQTSYSSSKKINLSYSFKSYLKKYFTFRAPAFGFLWKWKHPGFFSTLFLVILFSANPFTSQGHYLIPSAFYSEVLIRTKKWVYIELAGHKGYSPITIVLPRTGIYELKWKTHQQRCKKRL